MSHKRDMMRPRSTSRSLPRGLLSSSESTTGSSSTTTTSGQLLQQMPQPPSDVLSGRVATLEERLARLEELILTQGTSLGQLTEGVNRLNRGGGGDEAVPTCLLTDCNVS